MLEDAKLMHKSITNATAFLQTIALQVAGIVSPDSSRTRVRLLDQNPKTSKALLSWIVAHGIGRR
jgi:hypothetical protein